jgi:hypothetical protein
VFSSVLRLSENREIPINKKIAPKPITPAIAKITINLTMLKLPDKEFWVSITEDLKSPRVLFTLSS